MSPAVTQRDHVSLDKPARLVSLDAYRGFVMLLMASEGLGMGAVAEHYRQAGTPSALWNFLQFHTDHVEWRGCSLWDLIQPSFTFMVGVAMVYSLASRRAKGQSFGLMLLHAIWRSALLVWLGVFLRSGGRRQTYFTFEDTLSQIGLGYTFLFLLAWLRPRWQVAALCVVLVGYWAAFALYPLPSPGFDPATVDAPRDWPHHLHGFAAHWDKNTNFAAAVDQRILNWFPREKPFIDNGGGYLTLSFIPTLGTMILGLLAGQWMRSSRPPASKVLPLVVAGIAGLVLGKVLDVTGICPSVKRIWTPSWVLFSGGWCCLLLAGFYSIIDLAGWKRWAFPLVVVGMNSIAMYCMAHLCGGFIADSIRIHLGRNVFESHGEPFARMLRDGSVLLVLWLVCFWMYRRKIFLRI